MKINRIIVFVFFYLFFVNKISAETVVGCKIGNDTFLYTGYQGVQSFYVTQYYIPTFPTYTTPKKDFLNSWYNSYNNCPYFDGSPTYGEQCAVSGITTVKNGSVRNLGQTITYKLTYQCPIDDYIPFLLLFLGGISVFFLRSRTCIVVM